MRGVAATRSLDDLLSGLDAEQRAAAVLPDGPAQIIAPAGSGKTTTLVARLGVLIARGADPERILVVTFNRDAALELESRIRGRLVPIQPGAERIEVRTLHALGRQILLDAGWRGRLIADRGPTLRAARREVVERVANPADIPLIDLLDTIVSAAKLEGRAAPPDAAGVVTAYERLLERDGTLDFDDLVARPVGLLARDAALRTRWQARFAHVLVDEFQDVDASQLRLIGLLVEPEQNLFTVGDDDQTIYAWRLADVRRILEFSVTYPNARRVQLATNYRCPRDVVDASRRLIGVNAERFAKRIEAPAGARRRGCAIATVRSDHPAWPEQLAQLAAQRAGQASGACFLARTRAELMPVALALVRSGVPHAMTQRSPLEASPVVELVDALRRGASSEPPFARLLAERTTRGWRRADDSDGLSADDHDALDALLGWSMAYRGAGRFVAAFDSAIVRLRDLRDPDAHVRLMTVHAAKGLEFPMVAIVGFEEDRFPNRRAVAGSPDPARALEDERRLAYVATTRASELLVLVFDPAKPSRFVREMGIATGRPPAPRR